MYPGLNDVYQGPPTPGKLVIYGLVNTWEDCQAACQTNTTFGTCTAWTWHDETQGSYAYKCYFRLDGLWDPESQAGHYSGRPLPPTNIWVAEVSSLGITSVPGLNLNGSRLIRARYPNYNTELGFGSTLQAQAWLAGPTPPGPTMEVCMPLHQKTQCSSSVHLYGNTGTLIYEWCI